MGEKSRARMEINALSDRAATAIDWLSRKAKDYALDATDLACRDAGEDEAKHYREMLTDIVESIEAAAEEVSTDLTGESWRDE